MTDHSFFPTPGGIPGTDRIKAQPSRLALQIFACLCMFFITSCVFASGMAPYNGSLCLDTFSDFYRELFSF